MEISEKEKKYLKDIEEKPGFFRHNNFKFVEIDDGCAIIRADLNENSMNPYGIAHGGIIFGLGDMAMGIAVATTKKTGVTLNSTINYLRPGKGKYLIAKAKIIKKGKTTSYLRCDIFNDEDVLVASMDSNYYYIGDLND